MIKVLLIEDDLLIQSSISDLLEIEGFEVIATGSGVEGRELATRLQPDLVLCDILMPDEDGYAVLASLRGLPATSSLPFIFFTALADLAERQKGMKLGANAYLTKPYSRQSLLEAIATVLAGDSLPSFNQAANFIS